MVRFHLRGIGRRTDPVRPAFIAGQRWFGSLAWLTGGYIWAWPFAALLIGLCTAKLAKNRVLAVIQLFAATELFGSFFVYVGGVPQLAHVMHWLIHKALVGGMYPFLIGDLIKAIVATLIALAVRAAYSPQRLVLGSAADVVQLAEETP